MPGFESRFITAPDGLRLHVRDYGPRNSDRLPVLCLPGLSRNAEDFEEVATALADDATAPRRVLAIDFRGRGLSSYDANASNYAVRVETADVIAVITAMGAAPAIFLGTSRGGMVTMELATVRPAAIAGAILNDIGPVIEPKGMMRIKSYVGKLPEPRDYEEGADILRRTSGAQFPKFETSDWITAAHRMWRQENGRYIAKYDAEIARTLDSITPDRPIKTMWAQFEALGQMPLLVFRGANSDLLSMETVQEMQTRHPDMDLHEVPDQGHAPLIAEADTIGRVAKFAAECDALYA
jgi:pimeloyl-ACP methyl ester carboxylesterase